MGKKLLRDPKNGRILPGSGPLNPNGRPKLKRDILDKLMRNFYGPDCEALLLDVVEIAQYDKDVDYKNTESKFRKYFKPKFTNLQIVDARKFLFTHFYGAPVTESHTEITTPEDTSIEVKFIKNKK